MMTSEQAKPLEPLGYTRLRIFACLGGDMARLPQYLTLRPGEDAFEGFRRFVKQMVEICHEEKAPFMRALIGAARLLVGDLRGADEILDHLPATRVQLDHGAGYCKVVPMQALTNVLPVPAALRDARLVAGSVEEAELRSWLEQHRTHLVWEELRGQYHITEPDSLSGEP